MLTRYFDFFLFFVVDGGVSGAGAADAGRAAAARLPLRRGGADARTGAADPAPVSAARRRARPALPRHRQRGQGRPKVRTQVVAQVRYGTWSLPRFLSTPIDGVASSTLTFLFCFAPDILVTTPNRLVYLLEQEPPGISLKKSVSVFRLFFFLLCCYGRRY